MQPTLYSDDSVSSGKQMTLVVHLTVASFYVRMSSPNGESGIRQAGVCSNWKRDNSSPLIRHSLPRWLYRYVGQVRVIVESRGCGPLGGSVIIATEYTGVTCNGNVDAKSQSDQLLLFS